MKTMGTRDHVCGVAEPYIKMRGYKINVNTGNNKSIEILNVVLKLIGRHHHLNDIDKMHRKKFRHGSKQRRLYPRFPTGKCDKCIP